MLELNLGSDEYWDEEREMFVTKGGCLVQFEHSLLSISKWESKYRKPFLTNDTKTTAELLDYIEFMVIGPKPENLLSLLDSESIAKIDEYIQTKPTATWFTERDGTGRAPSTEIITSEIIYYWLFSYRLDITCETWNIHRLLTLIRVFSEKNSQEKGKKLPKAQLAQQRHKLNQARKAKLRTHG